MEPPLIGITAGNDPRTPGQYVIRWDYVRSIEQAGGIPVILAPSGAALHSRLTTRLDGVLLTGGVDIEPSVYGESFHPSVTRTSPERDEFEFKLIKTALQQKMPILAICRGLQVLNVAMGGSLVQDIPTMIGSEISHDDSKRQRHELAHQVTLKTESRLYEILKTGKLWVNSFHHQSAKTLGHDLIPVAWADDGVIEALELPNSHFVVGIQWHPESFWNQDGTFLALFESFTAAARSFNH
ncbi:gamma-glutamyl-gamma-aminobutyrate hydrolase family protein [bacterium]|nr:gamma-glutamyl-gamma-aminobutyrate hydrolase family protein [bacterium]